MFQKIMVAYDEGKVSDRALEKAIELAKLAKAEIYIVSVYMMVDNLSRIERLEKIQAEAAQKVDKAGLTAHTQLAPGGKVLGETLVKTADELKVDLIVIGSNNRGAIGELMFGSVSKHVLRYAACPVLVVK